MIVRIVAVAIFLPLVSFALFFAFYLWFVCRVQALAVFTVVELGFVSRICTTIAVVPVAGTVIVFVVTPVVAYIQLGSAGSFV